MPSVRRRLRRKELKQPDEFQTLVEKVQEFLSANLREVLMLGAAALVAALTVTSFYLYEGHRRRVAADRFYAAFSALQAKRYKIAERDFSELAARDVGLPVGRLAHFYLASVYLAEGNLDEARAALLAYLAADRDALFRGFALENLGLVYEKMGRFKDAKETYGQAAAVPGPQQLGAELDAARMMVRAGDGAGAIEAYRAFLKRHPFAPERPTVLQIMAELGASPKELATAPATPAPSAAPAATVAPAAAGKPASQPSPH